LFLSFDDDDRDWALLLKVSTSNVAEIERQQPGDLLRC
jgi:hypothetical protein